MEREKGLSVSSALREVGDKRICLMSPQLRSARKDESHRKFDPLNLAKRRVRMVISAATWLLLDEVSKFQTKYLCEYPTCSAELFFSKKSEGSKRARERERTKIGYGARTPPSIFFTEV